MIEIKCVREVHTEREMCANRACGQPLAGLPSLAYEDGNGKLWLMHVMCAHPRLRKAYHEAQSHG